MNSPVDKGLRLEVNWHDADVLRICIACWNGMFGGVADAYVEIGKLEQTAQKLQGFPRSPTDKREVILGQFGPDTAGGATSLQFFCANGAGHAYVEIKMEADQSLAGVTQSTVLVLRIEPASLDVFVADLLRLEADKYGCALLRAT